MLLDNIFYTGPTVKCVLLRCKSPTDEDDIIDNTREASSMSIKEIKSELSSYGVDASNFVEKADIIKALEGARENNSMNCHKNPAASAANDDDSDSKPPANDNTKMPNSKPVPYQNLIEEISIDTTPKKSMVSQVLGGQFTFLGQYEEEGIMVMIRRPDWEEFIDDDEEVMTMEDIPPVNPHELQPPFDGVQVRGDVLLMRVAETPEELDAESGEGEGELADLEEEVVDAADRGDSGAGVAGGKAGGGEKPDIHVPTNDEFFLDYTKEEYLKFAARTDIVAPEIESSEEEESDEEEVDELEDDDEDAKPSASAAAAAEGGEEHDNDDDDSEEDEDFDSEEHQIGMMNMILGHMLRKFREENGRGPDSLELLEMRKALADRLGVDVPPVDEEAADWDKKSPPRPSKKKREGGGDERKKVVVAEEKNEIGEIPCREGEEDGEGEEGVESLKRPADDEVVIDPNKKAKLNGENEAEEKKGDEEEEP